MNSWCSLESCICVFCLPGSNSKWYSLYVLHWRDFTFFHFIHFFLPFHLKQHSSSIPSLLSWLQRLFLGKFLSFLSLHPHLFMFFDCHGSLLVGWVFMYQDCSFIFNVILKSFFDWLDPDSVIQKKSVMYNLIFFCQWKFYPLIGLILLKREPYVDLVELIHIWVILSWLFEIMSSICLKKRSNPKILHKKREDKLIF